MRVRLQFTNGTHYAYHAEFDDVAPLAADIEAIRFGIQYLTARIFRLSSVTAHNIDDAGVVGDGSGTHDYYG